MEKLNIVYFLGAYFLLTVIFFLFAGQSSFTWAGPVILILAGSVLYPHYQVHTGKAKKVRWEYFVEACIAIILGVFTVVGLFAALVGN